MIRLFTLRAALFAAVSLTVACGRFPSASMHEPGWGNQRVLSALSRVRPQDVRLATADLDRCPRQPQPLRPETLVGLLERVPSLRPASTIGKVGLWDRWRLITIDCGAKGHFELFVGSRASLNGAPIVSIEAGTTTTEGGYYDGAALWAWFKTAPEVAALESAPPVLAPCD